MTPQQAIRSQPYRFARHLVASDQAWVAAMMHRTVCAEQRRIGMTPGKLPEQKQMNSIRAEEKLASMQDQILRLMADGKQRTISEISRNINAPRRDVDAAVYRMLAAKSIVAHHGGISVKYAIEKVGGK